jgi:hypothetical protein
MITPEDLTRLGYDKNGNSEYVCPHTFFICEGESVPLGERYETCLSRAAHLGGKKYHNKAYAGGIKFQSSCPQDLCNQINAFVGRQGWVITKVVFRKYRDGDIIALFPELPGDMNWANTCLSYMTVGQHGAANYAGVMNDTTSCSAKEAIALRQELEGVGYNLRTMKRQTADDVEARRQACKK